jgi:hypothetical protein
VVHGRPKDEDITRILVLFEAIVEGDTHILVTPSFKGLSKCKTIIKKKKTIFSTFFLSFTITNLKLTLVDLFIYYFK